MNPKYTQATNDAINKLQFLERQERKAAEEAHIRERCYWGAWNEIKYQAEKALKAEAASLAANLANGKEKV